MPKRDGFNYNLCVGGWAVTVAASEASRYRKSTESCGDHGTGECQAETRPREIPVSLQVFTFAGKYFWDEKNNNLGDKTLCVKR